MEVRCTYELFGEHCDEYNFYINDGDDLCIAQGSIIIGIGTDEIDPFMRQLNRFVEKERKRRKA